MRSNVRAVGQICPARGEEKSCNRRDRTARHSRRDPKSAPMRTTANETGRSVTNQAQMQTHTRQAQLAIRKAASNTHKTVAAARSAIRHFLASLHILVRAIATGISMALSIIIIISLVAFVSGSAYGIFSAIAPSADTIAVQ